MGRVENLDDLALEFGSKLSVLPSPSSYLGLPLVALFKFMADWDGVEERLHKRLVTTINPKRRKNYSNLKHSF